MNGKHARALTSGDQQQITETLTLVEAERGLFTLEHAIQLTKADVLEETRRDAAEKDRQIGTERKAQEDRKAAAWAIDNQQREEAAKKKQDEEDVRWRKWTMADGTKLGRARFGGVSFGRVRITPEGEPAKLIPLDDLSEGDRKWIADRINPGKKKK